VLSGRAAWWILLSRLLWQRLCWIRLESRRKYFAPSITTGLSRAMFLALLAKPSKWIWNSMTVFWSTVYSARRIRQTGCLRPILRCSRCLTNCYPLISICSLPKVSICPKCRNYPLKTWSKSWNYKRKNFNNCL
jgi:hypothetical protein